MKRLFTTQQFWAFIRESRLPGANSTTFRERAEKIGIPSERVPEFKDAINKWWKEQEGNYGGIIKE